MAAPIKIASDKRLQALIHTRDEWDVRRAADVTYELDVTDCDDVVSTFDAGLEAGIALANKVLASEDPDCKVFKLTLNNYGEDDALTFWVGTRDQVKARLEALKKGEDDEGDEDEGD